MRWRLSLLMFLQYAGPGAVLPLYSRHLERLGFSPREIGWCCATQGLASLVAPLAVGQVADRWLAANRCLVITATCAGFLFWTLATLATPAAVFAATLGLWCVMGSAITLGTALGFAHLAAPERDFGRVRLWGTIGWVASAWLLWLWLRADFPGLDLPPANLSDAFRLAGLLAFALAAYALTLPHTPPQRRLGSWLAPAAALRLMREPSFAVAVFGSFGVSLTLAVNQQTVPLLLHQLQVADEWLMPLQTISQTTEVLTLALLPMLLLRLETRGTMLLGLGVWTASLVVLALCESPWLAGAALAGWGLVVCCYIVAGQVFVNGRARGDIRASAQALVTALNGVGVLIGNVLAGWVRQASGGGLAPVFAVAAGIAAFVGLVFLIGFRPDRAKA